MEVGLGYSPKNKQASVLHRVYTLSSLPPTKKFLGFRHLHWPVANNSSVHFDTNPHSKISFQIVEFRKQEMASAQLTIAASSISAKGFNSFEGLRASNAVKIPYFSSLKRNGLFLRPYRDLVINSATTVAPRYTTLKPLGDRVLVKIKSAEEKTSGGIIVPTTAQSKPQRGEVVAVGIGRMIGKKSVAISLKTGAQVVCSKYAGTEVELHGSDHLILKEDDIVGILETDDMKDLKPQNDRVLIKVAVAEEKTAGGLYLTDASKEKPSIGMVVAVGPGSLDDEGNRKPLLIAPGNTVLYSKYAGNDFKGSDGSGYIALRASDVMAILS